jgi:hypothetical protein
MENKKIENSPIIDNDEFKEEVQSPEGAQCHWNGSWYNDGETTCINDLDHKCRDGRWRALGTREYCGKNTEEIFEFRKISIEQLNSPNTCSGNACSSISMRANFYPGRNTIRSLTIRNNGSRSVNFSITWGDILGGCGVPSSDVIFAGETFEMFTPHQNILGYCSIRANFQ